MDRDLELELHLRPIAEVLQKFIRNLYAPRNVGFALLLFDLGEAGNLAYISNAQRGDMIKALRECADKIGTDFDA